jgi:endonuclease/exonuclease/phosphatase family metal-dependent hydrolase
VRILLIAAVALTLVMAVLVAGTRQLSPSAVETVRPARSLAVVSVNTAKEEDANRILQDLRAAPRLREADLILMQEVANPKDEPSVSEQVAQKLGFQAKFAPAAPGVTDQGLAILSRYPLSNIKIQRLKACDLRFRCRSRFALSATVDTPWAKIRVWNAHLDTRINAAERLEQLEPVIDDAARQAGPRLIGGDFNTNEFRWLGNVLPVPGGPSHGGTIRHAMEAQGFTTPFADGLTTFPSLHRHLDWIFVRDLRPVASSVEPVPFSDHHAIWTRVAL